MAGELELYQNGKWVIGPLGMSKSVEERSTYDISVLDFLETYLDEGACRDFLSRSKVPGAGVYSAVKRDEALQLI